MHRARLLVAQCVRETARRQLLAPTSNALRGLTDSRKKLTASEEGLHPPQLGIENTGTEGAPVVKEAIIENSHEVEDEGSPFEELGDLGQEAMPTPAQALTSRLRRLRAVKGPGHLNQATQILAKARKDGVPRDITCYNILIKMIAMERWVMTEKTKPAMVEELLRMIEQDGLAMNIHTYNGIIFVYAKAQALAKAERAFDEMKSGGIEPNAITLSYMAMAQAWGSSPGMYRTLEKMDEKGWTPNRAAQLSVIASMWQRMDTEGVLRMIQLMFEKDYKPTEAAFAVALMSAAQLGRVDLAKVIFDRRNALGFEPKPEIYSCIMLAHAKADRHEESLSYWRQLVCLDGVGEVAIAPATCQAALKSAVVCNQWDEVDTIADMLKNQGPAATEHTYKAAVAACKARAGIDKPDFWRRVERIVEAIQHRTGVPPSPEVMCRLAMTYVLGKQWEKAAAIFEQVADMDVKMFAIRWEGVIQTYFALGRFSDVKDTWIRWRRKGGGALTVRANEVAMRAAHHLLDGEWAKEIMSLPADSNSKKGINPVTLVVAVDVLVDSGSPQEARQLLKDWKPTNTTQITFANFNGLLLCCRQHGGSDMILEMYQVLRNHNPLSRLRTSTLPLIIEALCKHDRAGDVVAMFKEQLAVGYQPGKSCYEAVARAAVEAGDTKASAQLLEAARNEMAVESGEKAAAQEGVDGERRVTGENGGRVSAHRQHQQSSTATAPVGAEE